MKSRFLFLSMSNDDDGAVGVVRWNDGARDLVLSRVRRVKEIAESDRSLTGMTFQSDICIFDVTGDFEEFICDTMSINDKNIYDALDDDRWAVADIEDVHLAKFTEARLDYRELNVTVYGSFHYEVLRKHSSYTMESMPLRCNGSGHEDLFQNNSRMIGHDGE